MNDLHDEHSEIAVLARENPELLGAILDPEAKRLGLPDFASFTQSKTEVPDAPKRPKRATYDGRVTKRQQVVEAVNKEYFLLHKEKTSEYESKKRYRDLLKPYSSDLAGYGTYLIENHPKAVDFFGMRRPFHLTEASRRLHTLVVGSSGSGKSEALKTTMWRYLADDPDSAIVYIDPHNDMAEQVAMFEPNKSNGRLAYIKPSLNWTDFPGLNPFDIEDKERLSDAEAERYSKEFIRAFKEILDDDLTEQMQTLLKHTVPVIVKMPGTSVYDLIDFLRPRQKEPKASKAEADAKAPCEYLAEKYLRFARANFENAVMLDFLATQFDDDAGYVTTRNSLTSRLGNKFGSTVMQALFRGQRTVRLEELIRARKLVVFNLSELADEEVVVGKFILITLKIFAINQAAVPAERRTPCHVIVDECQKFITESMVEILEQARKFKVFLTLAQPVVGGKMSPAMLESVLTNTATKMVGVYEGQSVDLLARTTGVPTETIKGLRTGQFVVHQREANPKAAIVRMPTNTLKNRAGMGRDDWTRVLAEQVGTYYRQPSQTTDSRAVPAGSTPEMPGTKPLNAYDPLMIDLDSHLN